MRVVESKVEGIIIEILWDDLSTFVLEELAALDDGLHCGSWGFDDSSLVQVEVILEGTESFQMLLIETLTSGSLAIVLLIRDRRGDRTLKSSIILLVNSSSLVILDRQTKSDNGV